MSPSLKYLSSAALLALCPRASAALRGKGRADLGGNCLCNRRYRSPNPVKIPGHNKRAYLSMGMIGKESRFGEVENAATFVANRLVDVSFIILSDPFWAV